MAERRATVAFDVIGTLFGLEQLRSRLTDLGAPPPALELWFEQSLRGYFALSHAGGYAPLAEVLKATLPFSLRIFEVDVSEEAMGEVMDGFTELDPSEGAEQACRTFAETDLKIIAVTNGSEETTRALLGRVGLDKHFEEILSCDAIEISKPHRDVYAAARKRAEGDLWMVAAHAWDIAGAKRAGLKAAWVAAKEREFFPLYPEPDVTGSDLSEVAYRIVETLE